MSLTRLQRHALERQKICYCVDRFAKCRIVKSLLVLPQFIKICHCFVRILLYKQINTDGQADQLQVTLWRWWEICVQWRPGDKSICRTRVINQMKRSCGLTSLMRRVMRWGGRAAAAARRTHLTIETSGRLCLWYRSLRSVDVHSPDNTVVSPPSWSCQIRFSGW